jgi:uncharacterized membrane protein (DUF2068 family)
MTTVPQSQLPLKQRLKPHELKALRAVALLELVKGLAALLIGFALFTLINRGQLSDVAERMLEILHVNPDRRLAQRFLDLADRLGDIRLWALALLVAAYSTLRFAEGYGLWKARAWAEWIALVSGALYLPFEIHQVLHRANVFHVAVLLINVAVVLYMAYLRVSARRAAHFQL